MRARVGHGLERQVDVRMARVEVLRDGLFSTATCSGASPPPRQQYQRISTWPGCAVLPPEVTGVATAAPDGLAAADAPAEDPAEAPAEDPVDADGVVPLHAETTSARAATDVATRDVRKPIRAPPCDRRDR